MSSGGNRALYHTLTSLSQRHLVAITHSTKTVSIVLSQDSWLDLEYSCVHVLIQEDKLSLRYDRTALQHLWGSRDISLVKWPFDTPPHVISYWLVLLWNQASIWSSLLSAIFNKSVCVTVSGEILDVECNAINALLTWPWYDLWTNVKVIHFCTNRFLIYDFI